jgi:hypothetical protein
MVTTTTVHKKKKVKQKQGYKSGIKHHKPSEKKLSIHIPIGSNVKQ